MDENMSSGIRRTEPVWRSRLALSCTIGLALAVTALLSGCSTKEASAETPTVTVQVDAAEAETIQRKVDADAIVYPLDQAAIVPRVSAPIEKFYVDRGSRVHAGQVLAELENKDLASAVAENEGGVQQAQAAYQAAVQKGEQDVHLAKEQLDAAQRQYNSRQALLKEGAVSEKDVEDASIALTQAKDQYAVAQKNLDLEVAQGQLQAAKAKTESAQLQLQYAKITSPIDGVVTDRPLYAGEMAPAGSPILTVMNLSQVVARAHISQQQAAQLKVGDPATISIPSQPGDFKGRVTLVSPALDPNSTTVEVWVQVPNPAMKLKPGASVRVSMVGETVKNAIVAPAAALLTDPDGVTSVIVLDSDNKPTKKKVKVGIRSGNDVQILDGLKNGDRVVTVGAFELDKMDEDVLAKAKIQVQAPKMPEEDEDEDQ